MPRGRSGEMKIAVFGAGGLVGSYACREFENNNHEVLAVSKDSSACRLDAADYDSVLGIIRKEKPDAVINAIKSSLSTDKAETCMGEAWEANVIAAENLAKLQKEHGFFLVHISSDWVYEGKEHAVYTESSIPYPQNFYSFTKAVAEERVLKTADNPLILRPGSIFGIDSKKANFFMRIKQSIEKQEKTSAARDQYCQPIFAGELARIIRTAVEKKITGIYNSVGNDYMSRYELALLFCDIFGWDKHLVVPVTSSERSIKIPRYLRLDISKLESGIRKMPALAEQVRELKEETG